MNPDWIPAAQRLGATYLSTYQELVVSNILETPRLRQAVVLPTGAGKSLCFQLPALLLPHPTLVIFPLKSLMADQVRRCDQANLPTAVLQGGQTRAVRTTAFERIESGKARLVITNPETLLQPSVQKRLSQVRFSHAVIDEAHCYTLWGGSFRPLYRELPRLLELLTVDRITAFTATASPRVLEDWRTLFGGQAFSLIRGGADRPNIEFLRQSHLSLRTELPRQVLSGRRPMLVFCRSRDRVRHWAHHLHRETGADVRFYHAGLSRDEKKSVEHWFLHSPDGVLVATNAYGMGVDKPDIRTVLHLEFPPTTEDYLQEAGRAGRDGRPAKAVLLQASVVSDPGEAVCWRRRLLACVDSEPEVCSGCDHCNGQSGALAWDLATTCRALSVAIGRFDRQECLAFLRGHEGELGGRWKRTFGWGLWRRMDDLTASEVWAGLEQGGWLVWSSRRSKALLKSVKLV